MQNNEQTKTIDFYTNTVPEPSQTIPKLPIGRIVELFGNYDDYASNRPNSIQFNVQIDVWVKTLDDVNKYYFVLDEIMRDEFWECVYTEQTDDPDLQGSKRIIKRYIKTMYLH